ncbi:MAG: TIGR04325 family methyltransferase [Dolichospermum sp.]|jgi:putative methyltransferase (TIGR04325 family)
MLSSQLKLTIKEITPPFLWKVYKKLTQKYGFFGDYSSWEAAARDSVGYDSDIILNKVKESMLKVKEGKAVYARDSVLFDKIEYSFPVLAALLRIASANGNKLSVLDFGGSLGSHYYQYKDFLSELQELRWSIVEQKNFVECGKELFENEQLKFYFDIDSCLANEQPDVILLSGVLQCLPKPYEFVNNLIDRYFKFILIDRTGFVKNNKDILTIQKVPPEIYEASYPAWFFNQDKFLDIFRQKYNLIIEFETPDMVNIDSVFKGFIFELKKK